jgi:Fic family protein
MTAYIPPYQITPAILNRVADISERLGRWSESHNNSLSPHLRRDNRIKTIQASLAIENNTLSLEQVTAVLDGKRVLGLPHEIQEVRNAFIAYEKLNDWQAHNINHLLAAHHALMAGLLDDAGQFRSRRCRYLSWQRIGTHGTASQSCACVNAAITRLAQNYRLTPVNRQLYFSL